MNMILVNAALKILGVWCEDFEKYTNDKSMMVRRYAIRWKTIGLINHDRVLSGRRDLISGLGAIKNH